MSKIILLCARLFVYLRRKRKSDVLKTQKEILDAAAEAGLRKAALSSCRENWGRLAVLSVMAGAFISLGGVLSVIIGFGFPEISAQNPGLQKLLSALAFPIGLFLVVTFGAELFTGNNAVLMPSFLGRRYGFGAVAANWTLVWLGNFAGALLFTYFLVAVPGLLDSEPYRSAIVNVAQSKTSLAPMVCFLKGIGANWCVCLAVWLALGAKTLPGKTLSCWIPVAAFVALGYEHCIANMFFIPAGMFAGADVTLAGMGRNLIASTAGNIAGGALFVGCLSYWLHSERGRARDNSVGVTLMSTEKQKNVE